MLHRAGVPSDWIHIILFYCQTQRPLETDNNSTCPFQAKTDRLKEWFDAKMEKYKSLYDRLISLYYCDLRKNEFFQKQLELIIKENRRLTETLESLNHKARVLLNGCDHKICQTVDKNCDHKKESTEVSTKIFIGR